MVEANKPEEAASSMQQLEQPNAPASDSASNSTAGD